MEVIKGVSTTGEEEMRTIHKAIVEILNGIEIVKAHISKEEEDKMYTTPVGQVTAEFLALEYAMRRALKNKVAVRIKKPALQKFHQCGQA